MKKEEKENEIAASSLSTRLSAYRCIDLDQSDVCLLIDVFDLGIIRGSALQLHLEEIKRSDQNSMS